MRNTTVALQVSRIRKKREKEREKEGNNDYWLGEIYIYGVVSSAVEYLENKF